MPEPTFDPAVLLDLAQAIATTPDEQQLFGAVLERIRALVDYIGALIFTLDEGQVVVHAQRGALPAAIVPALLGHCSRPPDGARALIIADAQVEGLESLVCTEIGAVGAAVMQELRSLLYQPLEIGMRTCGGLVLAHTQPHHFAREHIRVLAALTHLAALSLEHTRLLEQARDFARQQERRRIARELHDSVTQTLFAISITAEVLPQLWMCDRAAALQSLEDLRTLARGALAEMRTLLLELRPEALEQLSLSRLLVHLVEALRPRVPAPIALTIDTGCDPPQAVKIVFYRIAQEALHNIAKHAVATQVAVELRRTPAGLELAITDNGCGFDVADIAPDHLGLQIMRERAAEIGASLVVQSQEQHGTQVVVQWPVATPAGEERRA